MLKAIERTQTSKAMRPNPLQKKIVIAKAINGEKVGKIKIFYITTCTTGVMKQPLLDSVNMTYTDILERLQARAESLNDSLY